MLAQFCLALALLSPAAPAEGAEPRAAAAVAPDVAVVCPPSFREALAPWIKHRAEQGHCVELLASDGTPDTIRTRIAEVAKRGGLKFVVLVGDADPAARRDAAVRARSVATHHAKSKVVVRWGSEPELATDNPYADLDGDGLPDVAIGRLTCDTPQELSRVVAKILAYEKSTDLGVWRRRVSFVAGVGGFGALADAAIESGARMVICDGVPAAYATTVTFGSWQSPYCPPPASFGQATLDRINEGSLFWVYIGHGHRRGLDAIQVPGKAFPILSAREVGKMQTPVGSPIALFLACYTGAFDGAEDCLAEEMLRSDGAPVAAICGSRVTMPYAMAVMGGELMQECFVKRRETIGEIILHAKRSLVDEKGTAPNRQMLDAIAAAVSPNGTKPADERAEHVLLFNLIGDPLLRVPHPAAAKVIAPRFATAGDVLRISGECAVDGKCVVELVVRRDRLAFDPPERERYEESAESLAGFAETYRRANDPRLVETSVEVREGKFAAEIAVPADIDGPCNIRVFVTGGGQAAIGASDVYVRRRKSESTAGNGVSATERPAAR
jgi:hypothetical protein